MRNRNGQKNETRRHQMNSQGTEREREREICVHRDRGRERQGLCVCWRQMAASSVLSWLPAHTRKHPLKAFLGGTESLVPSIGLLQDSTRHFILLCKQFSG